MCYDDSDDDDGDDDDDDGDDGDDNDDDDAVIPGGRGVLPYKNDGTARRKFSKNTAKL